VKEKMAARGAGRMGKEYKGGTRGDLRGKRKVKAENV
jgi:hypothetical protein